MHLVHPNYPVNSDKYHVTTVCVSIAICPYNYHYCSNILRCTHCSYWLAHQWTRGWIFYWTNLCFSWLLIFNCYKCQTLCMNIWTPTLACSSQIPIPMHLCNNNVLICQSAPVCMYLAELVLNGGPHYFNTSIVEHYHLRKLNTKQYSPAQYVYLCFSAIQA